MYNYEKYERRERFAAKLKSFAKKAVALGVIAGGAALFLAAAPDWTPRQIAVHQIAEIARSVGIEETSPIITECGRLWWEDNRDVTPDSSVKIPELALEELVQTATPEQPAYSQQELDILAKTIWKEAEGCPWEHQCAVGCVVLNRVSDDRFPDTIEDVVGQPGQYHSSYLSGFEGIPDVCYDAARAVLNGEYSIPPEIVWQANFVQGQGVWWISSVNTGWDSSTTYFCW